MKKKMAYSVLGLALRTACIATAASQTKLREERTSLPIPEPQIIQSTVLDD
jgi:hypothetical protein